MRKYLEKSKSVGQKIHPQSFLTYSPNGWKFLVQILHAYYSFMSTLDYTQRAFRPMVDISNMWIRWSLLIWHNFVKVANN